MKEFHRKRKTGRFPYSPAVILLLLALVVFMAKAVWSVYGKERESRKNLNRASEELSALKAREALLTERIEYLKTEGGIETEIREQFQVAKPGERMVVIVAEKKTADETAEPKQSLISRFFDMFR